MSSFVMGGRDQLVDVAYRSRAGRGPPGLYRDNHRTPALVCRTFPYANPPKEKEGSARREISQVAVSTR